MRKLAVLLLVAVILAGCTPPERVAYETVVASKAFIDQVKKQHPECPATNSAVCSDLAKATGAKDSLIDVVEILCAGPNFNSGGSCDFPKKGTPGYQQAVDKLNAAIAQYNQAASDLKAVL
ncbi:MAG TPA: hypothetical protein VNH19_17605 [Candidatus Limnocylindrales bacterium]|nr:hypothetical protein [Candidatus Limnocylindrales bacterium]